jgi:hypothetical protein
MSTHKINPWRLRVRPAELITREEFLADRHGKTFADVVDDSYTPFDAVLEFFNDSERQQRMEDSEIHHDRAPLAGVVREFEARPVFRQAFASLERRRSARLRQAIGVLVRMIMERRGWLTTGKKGSLGVRGKPDSSTPRHNTGGLALWFIRAERYRRQDGMPFRSVRELSQEFEAADPADPADPADRAGAADDGRRGDGARATHVSAPSGPRRRAG